MDSFGAGTTLPQCDNTNDKNVNDNNDENFQVIVSNEQFSNILAPLGNTQQHSGPTWAFLRLLVARK